MEIRDAWGLDNLKSGQRPDPKPGPREVVIRMDAASVNYGIS
jgi:NADPH:quinone reductase-like Zn-dependent oxidoreductase